MASIANREADDQWQSQGQHRRNSQELHQAVCKGGLLQLHHRTQQQIHLEGREQELESINLINSVRFTDYVKNEWTIENDYLIGTADIVIESRVIDVKTSWSLDTFPALMEDAVNPLYEWQLRAYMMLYNKPCAELIYCMVTK